MLAPRPRPVRGRASTACGRLPLGAGALAGVNFDTDRGAVAAALGFAGVAENSIDAVSNRDFVLDYLAAAATCATHLSRLGAEIVLWSSEEFGFCEVSDAWASGSSIMPQKKNPDAAELLRAKAPRRGRQPVGAARRDARPAADLQQGHAGGQGAAVRLRATRSSCAWTPPTGCCATITFNRERLAAAAGGPVPRRDRRRRPAGPARDAVPRGPRGRRRAGAARGRAAAGGSRS